MTFVPATAEARQFTQQSQQQADERGRHPGAAMLDVLWLARSIPWPANSGDRIYTGTLVSRVAEAGARIAFLGLADQDCVVKDAVLNRSVTWTVVPGLPRGTVRALFDRNPVVAARYGTPSYRRYVREFLARNSPDAVVLDQYGLVFALDELDAVGYRGAVVHIAHDFETKVTRDLAASFTGSRLHKLALRLNAARTATAERRLARASHLVAALTEPDCEAFRRIGARRTIALPPGYDGPVAEASWSAGDRHRRVVIIGSFRWTAKQLNLTRFLAAADARLAAAGIVIDIVGDVPAALRSAWEPKLKAARFHGFVKEPTSIFRSCRLGLIIEETGGGFKLKALDYVFNGIPVAALRGSFEGVPPSISRQFLVADDADALTTAVIATIDDDARLQAMQAEALRAAGGQFDWRRTAQDFLRAVGEAAQHGMQRNDDDDAWW
jgi:glycosyltransferase involved in cell wall biosynthesis